MSVDLVGPVKLKHREWKTWILINLCNVSKALHLQLVENYIAKAVTIALNTLFGVKNLSNKNVIDVLAPHNIHKPHLA